MDSKGRIERFVETMLAENDSYPNPLSNAEVMGLSRREFGEATSEVWFEQCKRTARNFVNRMMESGIGEPVQNEIVAQYIAHMVHAQITADYLRNTPGVNFGKVKYFTKKVLKDERKNAKKVIRELKNGTLKLKDPSPDKPGGWS